MLSINKKQGIKFTINTGSSDMRKLFTSQFIKWEPRQTVNTTWIISVTDLHLHPDEWLITTVCIIPCKGACCYILTSPSSGGCIIQK